MATTIGLALVALGSELARRRAKRRADELERDKASLSLEIEALSKVAGVSGVLGATTNSTTRALGNVKGVNGMNRALWAMGAFKHEPPNFEYFDPVLTEQMCVLFKEIRLPMAEQTHELCYEPVSRSLFVTQMSNSVLVRVPVGARGLILDDQDAWRVGPHDRNGNGVSGLHNVSLSRANPGCVWLTMQTSNTLLLVEATSMKLRRILKVPTLLKRADGTAALVGGPHCLRECPKTGDIWVALKGTQGCHPGEIPGLAAESGKKGFALAKERVCCDPKALRKRMDELSSLGYDAPPPEGFAVWRVQPDEYDPDAYAHGGELVETAPSPPMVAVDANGDCWVAQDQSTTLLRVPGRPAVERAKNSSGALPVPSPTQFALPHPPAHDARCSMRIAGPAVQAAPDGAVWCSLLGAQGGVVRACCETGERTRYDLPVPPWMHAARFIHIVFHVARDVKWVFNDKWVGWGDPRAPRRAGKDGELIDPGTGMHVMFAISSNLVEDDAMNALYVLAFDPSTGTGWQDPVAFRVIPLPTQDCSCHRIEVICDGLDPEDASVVVSELHTSKIWQMKIQFGISQLNFAAEEDLDARDDVDAVETLEDGSKTRVRRFHEVGGIAKFAGEIRGADDDAVILESSKRKIGTLLDAMRRCGGEGEDGIVRMERGDPDCEEVKMWSFMWNGLRTAAERDAFDAVAETPDGDLAKSAMCTENPGKFESARSLFTSATAKMQAEKKAASAKLSGSAVALRESATEKKAAIAKFGQKPE